jgi:lambda family phage portal protein
MESASSALAARELASGRGSQLAAASRGGLLGRGLDAVASAISPAWGAARIRKRAELAIASGGYDVTQPSRTRRRQQTWAQGHADNAQTERTLWDLREICRDHDRNSCLLHGIISRCADNAAGPEWGFLPDSGDASFDRDAADLLREASAAAEYRGLFDLQGVLYTAFRSLLPDGDCLAVHLADNRMQMLEAHELATPAGGKGFSGRTVVGGVELDDAGRHTAYYVVDPREVRRLAAPRGFWAGGYSSLQRIDAADCDHWANRERFSATRGVPVLASSLDLFSRLDGYLDSETLAAELTSHLTWWMKSRDGAQLPGSEIRTDGNATADTETAYDRWLRSEPGVILNLGTDEEAGVIDPKRPGLTFEPYTLTMLRMVGAGIGIPLELVLLDFSRTNYSSARAALLQAYRTFRVWQRFIRERMIQRVYSRWVSRWIARRALSPLPNAARLKFFPPRWAWVDPLKEALAMEKKIQAAAGTLEDWISEDGRLAETIFTARAAELKRLRQLGVPTSTVLASSEPPAAAAGDAERPPAAPGRDGRPDEPDDDEQEQPA